MAVFPTFGTELPPADERAKGATPPSSQRIEELQAAQAMVQNGASEQVDVQLEPPTQITDSRNLRPNEIPPSPLSYDISVGLAVDTRRLVGHETITWEVPGGKAVERVPLHLYLNAFRNSASTWMRGATALRGFDVEKYLDAFDDPWGMIAIQKITQVIPGKTPSELSPPPNPSPAESSDAVDAKDAAPPVEDEDEDKNLPLEYRFVSPDDGNANDRTLIEVELAEPVQPGDKLILSVKFVARLPVPVARTGGMEHYFHIAQWFPKLGMYEVVGTDNAQSDGFAARQFHGPTEFYAEYADFNVSMQVPRGYRVVATGEQLGDVIRSATGYVEYEFAQRGVHDFAWVASDTITIDKGVFKPSVGPPIELSIVVPAGQENLVPQMRQTAESTFDLMSRRVGPYPYSTMKVVAPPYGVRQTGGMEYPTLVTTTPGDDLLTSWPLENAHLNDGTTAHEVIHNYFYGLVGSNEQRHAFLDEGFTTFWTHQVEKELYRNIEVSIAGFPLDYQELGRGRSTLFDIKETAKESILRSPANLFYQGTHGPQIYFRSLAIFETLSRRFGVAEVDKLFSTYFARHRFRHPGPDDFIDVAKEVLSAPAFAFLTEQFFAKELPDYAVASVSVEEYVVPLGLFLTDESKALDILRAGDATSENEPEGTQNILVGTDDRDLEAFAKLGAESTLLDSSKGIVARIYDAGFVFQDERKEGAVQVRALPQHDASGAVVVGDDEDKLFSSTVVLTGPGLRELPVDVYFLFEDGAQGTDTWDGKSAWREYSFVRGSRLKEVRVDPENKVLVDVNPHNNGHIEDAESSLAQKASALLVSVFQWCALGLAWWI